MPCGIIPVIPDLAGGIGIAQRAVLVVPGELRDRRRAAAGVLRDSHGVDLVDGVGELRRAADRIDGLRNSAKPVVGELFQLRAAVVEHAADPARPVIGPVEVRRRLAGVAIPDAAFERIFEGLGNRRFDIGIAGIVKEMSNPGIIVIAPAGGRAAGSGVGVLVPMEAVAIIEIGIDVATPCGTALSENATGAGCRVSSRSSGSTKCAATSSSVIGTAERDSLNALAGTATPITSA